MIQFRELLQRLSDARIDFVVVGGVAATLHGVAEPTRDLDVCIAPTQDTWARVASVIAELEPRYALTPDRRPVDLADVASGRYRNLYVLTKLGRLDLLGEVPPLGELSVLNEHAVTMQLDDLAIRVISIDDLLTVKEHVRRPKDLEVAAELRVLKALKR